MNEEIFCNDCVHWKPYSLKTLYYGCNKGDGHHVKECDGILICKYRKEREQE